MNENFNNENSVEEDSFELNLIKDGETFNEVNKVIDERILPVVTKDGGEVKFHGLSDKNVVLDLKGSAYGLLGGIENMIKHFVPKIDKVVSLSDALPKPGLNSSEGIAVQELLDNEINPSVAMHGGHISLIDVKDNTVFIRLEGGCQGCGMADVTLKQGVEVTIKNNIPTIKAVLDTTDHADGKNPYFQN